MEITFGIIGTAGRKDDKNKLSLPSFKAMYTVAEELIRQLGENNYPITHAVSGGAAWADHVAVKLYLNKVVRNLRLYLPSPFESGSFSESPSDKNSNGFSIARTINSLHEAFRRATQINSLSEIQVAACEGAELLPCRGGFYGRNAMVAKSDILLAMTFGNKQIVKEGGTADTVRKYLIRVEKEGFFNKSFHYNLSDGQVYIGVEAPNLPNKINR